MTRSIIDFYERFVSDKINQRFLLKFELTGFITDFYKRFKSDIINHGFL